MKSREEISQMVESAEAAKADPATFDQKVKVLFESLLEYPAPVAQTADEVKSIFENGMPSDSSTVSDNAYPVFVVRDILSVKRLPINPVAIGESWDLFSERYQDLVLAA